MRALERWWQATVAGETRGPGATLARAALAGLSAPYSAVMRANLKLYESGLKPRTTPAIPVASVGNITLGGTGKTTTTRRLVRDLTDRGVCPGIVLRGHMRDVDQPWQLISDGSDLLVEPRVAGDEATMLAATAPGAPIAVGKRRERVVELLADAGAQVVVLDDGFQYFRMEREVDLVLADATFDLADARVFPAGYLREPLEHLRRATHLLITHADLAGAEQIERIVQVFERYAPDAPVMLSRHAPEGVRPLGEPTADGPPEDIAGMRVVAMCAVGNPQSFVQLLTQMGAQVVDTHFFPDHHAYHPDDWLQLREAPDTRRAEAIVVTEKDAVKLPPPPADLPPIAAVSIDLEITRNEESWDALASRIEQAARQKPSEA